ncbi:MAG TPA: uroporphyrinogen-III C-methyltransferase [Candidatus Dormibacteraeota bacterium]|nr:uroporphyrinogen-III C-methyltransferase [Candidatus Dormibacteraeota bacterium]
MGRITAGRVSLVGAGPGDPGLLTLHAARALGEAEVLLYDALASEATIALAAPDCERIFVGKRGGEHAMAQEAIEELMLARARAGKRVVRLKGGDPYVFGRGGEEAQCLKAAGIPFEVIPGISSAIAAPAYAGIPVTHRDCNIAFTVASGHEDPTKLGSTLDWAKLADPNRTLVFLMAMGNLAEISERLCEHGLDAARPAAVIADGTRPTQRTVVGTLGTIAAVAAEAAIGAPAIFIVGDVVALREQLRWFDNSPLFGKRLLVTRPIDRAEEFAAAALARGIEPILAPTIQIEAPDDVHRRNDAVDAVGTYAWVVFTSRNGVEAFFRRLHEIGGDARSFGHARVAVIGAPTARYLASFGVIADLVPEHFVGEELAAMLIERSRPASRMLLFRAQEGRDALPRSLARAGLNVDDVAAYRTSFPRDPTFAAKAARADILTFTSASTVRGYIEQFADRRAALESTRGKTVACIGPITHRAACDAGITVDIVAETSSSESLLDALEMHARHLSPP